MRNQRCPPAAGGAVCTWYRQVRRQGSETPLDTESKNVDRYVYLLPTQTRPRLLLLALKFQLYPRRGRARLHRRNKMSTVVVGAVFWGCGERANGGSCVCVRPLCCFTEVRRRLRKQRLSHTSSLSEMITFTPATSGHGSEQASRRYRCPNTRATAGPHSCFTGDPLLLVVAPSITPRVRRYTTH